MKDMPQKTATRQHWVCILFSKYLRQSKLMAQHLMITCQLHHMKLCTWSSLLKSVWIQTPCWIFPHLLLPSGHVIFHQSQHTRTDPRIFWPSGNMIVDATGMTLVPKIFGISPRKSHSRYIEVLTWFGMCQPLADLAGCIQKKGHWTGRVSRWASPRCDIWGLPLWSLRKIAHTFKWFHMLRTTANVVLSISEGSLEVKLPTIWTDDDRWKSRGGKSQRREEKRVEERRSEKRKSQKKEDADAGKGRKVGKHCVFLMICGSGGSKSRLAKAAGAEPSGQMRDLKLHAVVARSTFRSQNV